MGRLRNGRMTQPVQDDAAMVVICYSYLGSRPYLMPVPIERAAAQAYIDTYVGHLPAYKYWLEPVRWPSIVSSESLGLERGHDLDQVLQGPPSH